MSTERVELSARESTALLRSRSVGRICLIDHGYPVAIPVNYQIVGGDDDRIVAQVVMRTAPDTLLGRYEGLGSLEVDDVTLDRGSAWSVIVRGHIRPQFDADQLPDPQPLVDTDRERWMTLSVLATSGRRFAVHRSNDGHTVLWRAEKPSTRRHSDLTQGRSSASG